MPKLAKLEDWKAPWEEGLKEGEDPTIDPDRLKRYLHGLLSDKEGLQAQVAERDTKIKGLETQISEKAREGESETQRLTRERDEALEQARKAGETSIETLRLQVALDKGLNKVQAKRLVGSTKDELEADADELLEAWGDTSGGDEGDPDDALVRTAPKARARSGGDPTPQESTLDVDKAAANYVASQSILG